VRTWFRVCRILASSRRGSARGCQKRQQRLQIHPCNKHSHQGLSMRGHPGLGFQRTNLFGGAEHTGVLYIMKKGQVATWAKAPWRRLQYTYCSSMCSSARSQYYMAF